MLTCTTTICMCGLNQLLKAKGTSSSIIVWFEKSELKFSCGAAPIILHYFITRSLRTLCCRTLWNLFSELEIMCHFFHIRLLLSLSFILKGMKVLVLDRTSKSRVVFLSFKDIEGRFSNFWEELVRPCRGRSDLKKRYCKRYRLGRIFFFCYVG